MYEIQMVTNYFTVKVKFYNFENLRHQIPISQYTLYPLLIEYR